jgi:dolichol-phosphate mannosyltransferase
MLSRAFLERVARDAEWPSVASESLPLFRILLLQQWLATTGDAILTEVEDRASFRRFCGLSDAETIPSAQTLAAFRDQMPPGILADFAARWRPDGAILISVVSPVYRAAAIVDEFVRQVTAAVSTVTEDFEIVLVEDGSGDDTWERVAAACAADSRVKGVKLARNFGQHYAITAGLERARGAYVVVLDCDLQDDPAYIPQLYARALQGNDVVLTSRGARAHGPVKQLFARLFAGSLRWTGGGEAADWLVGGYSILSRRAVDALLRIRDVHRHYLAMLRWLGFPVALVDVVHRPRYRGRSSYTTPKLVRHAVDGWVSHSNRLLYIAVGLGFFFLFAAIAGVVAVVSLYFIHGFAPGWASLVVLILTSTGVTLLCLGVVGIYVGKIFDQARARPLYVVERTLND